MSAPKLLLSVLTASVLSLTLSACGSDGDKVKKEYDRVEDQVKNEYDRLEDKVKEKYKAVEDKLSDDEKSMAEILESVFLPEESLDKFLDKLTPEGGRGGLYVGHFVEIDDGDNSDIDIGAVYFDISKDGAGSVDGSFSYQQQACQENNALGINSAIKVDNYIAGKVTGSLDTLEFLDIKYVSDLGIETPNLLTTFAGNFAKNEIGKPWKGSFEYQDGLGGKKLSSGQDNCQVTYTISDRSNFKTYPLDYKLGTLNLDIIGNGSQKTVTWQNPNNTKNVLVSQIDVNKAESGANGYVQNLVLSNLETQFSPVVSDKSTNYAIVVQAFDSNNTLIGYQALVQDLPESL
ncbi:hypothetical protein [Psychrobacter sp. ANT_WB68]|uniref:hypothetical protein n=1 Tax=Psychrobacter sp. ANT_WB68 TaxID=2597355 RepID=UPI0011F19418|nr:hypothetical protein [Psychrobacter sp. ANT_WB68]KAA0914411.1 hypothetical protein FQ084_07530 [Psychrobacter sp. ANT_WB68]